MSGDRLSKVPVGETVLTSLPEGVLRRPAGVEYLRVGQDEIQISSLAGRSTTLEGHSDVVAAILDLYRDPAPSNQAVAALREDGFAEAEIINATEFLTKRGYLVSDRGHDWSDPLLELIGAIHPMSSNAPEPLPLQIAATKVTVVGEGTMALAARSGLKAAGFQMLEGGLDAALDVVTDDCLIVACSDWDDIEGLRQINLRAVAAGARAYYARMLGAHLVLGPFVVPRQLPCFGCYADRLESNISFIKEFRAKAAGGGKGSAPLNVREGSLLMAAMQYHVAMDLSWHILGRPTQSRLSEVRDIDLTSGEVDKAPLLRAPRCEACGLTGEGEVRWAVRDLL